MDSPSLEGLEFKAALMMIVLIMIFASTIKFVGTIKIGAKGIIQIPIAVQELQVVQERQLGPLLQYHH